MSMRDTDMGSGQKMGAEVTSDDPEVISRQIDHTRDAMAGTLDEIQRRLEPEQVSSYVKDVAYYVVLELKSVARDFANESMRNVRSSSAGKTADATAMGSQVGSRLTEPTRAFLSRYSGGSAGKKAEQMSNQSQGLWKKLEANPIALGAIGLAVGGVVGAIAPRLQGEDQLMGEARDRVMENVQATASETVDSLRSAAKETGSAVLQEATSSHRQG